MRSRIHSFLCSDATMILSSLESIAEANDLAFIYGQWSALNQQADSVRRNQIILFHDGFISGPVNEDLQGGWEWNYSLNLYFLRQSEPTDTPAFRRPNFEQLQLLIERVLYQLKHDYYLTNAVADWGINLTTQNVDGIHLRLNAKAKLVNRLC